MSTEKTLTYHDSLADLESLKAVALPDEDDDLIILDDNTDTGRHHDRAKLLNSLDKMTILWSSTLDKRRLKDTFTPEWIDYINTMVLSNGQVFAGKQRKILQLRCLIAMVDDTVAVPTQGELNGVVEDLLTDDCIRVLKKSYNMRDASIDGQKVVDIDIVSLIADAEEKLLSSLSLTHTDTADAQSNNLDPTIVDDEDFATFHRQFNDAFPDYNKPNKPLKQINSWVRKVFSSKKNDNEGENLQMNTKILSHKGIKSLIQENFSDMIISGRYDGIASFASGQLKHGKGRDPENGHMGIREKDRLILGKKFDEIVAINAFYNKEGLALLGSMDYIDSNKDRYIYFTLGSGSQDPDKYIIDIGYKLGNNKESKKSVVIEKNKDAFLAGISDLKVLSDSQAPEEDKQLLLKFFQKAADNISYMK